MLPPDSQQTNRPGTSAADSEQMRFSPSRTSQDRQDSSQSDQWEQDKIPTTQPEINPPTDLSSQPEESTSTTQTIPQQFL